MATPSGAAAPDVADQALAARLRDAWRLAVGTLTAVPVRPPVAVDRRRAGLAMILAPLATLPLALAAAVLVLIGEELELPPLVVALLALGATIVGNRAFHLDGLADTVDGLAASYDRERSLAVMKTGTAGPAGVVAIVLVVGLQTAALAGVLVHAVRQPAAPGPSEDWRAAVLTGAVLGAARAALALCCLPGVPSARPGGLGDTYTRTVPRLAAALTWGGVAVVLSAAGAWAGLAWWRGAVAAAAAAVVVGLLLVKVVRRLGGVTGDVFGAAIELALAAMLVALS